MRIRVGFFALLAVVSMVGCGVGMPIGGSAGPSAASAPPPGPGLIACSQLENVQAGKQLNMRAYASWKACGRFGSQQAFSANANPVKTGGPKLDSVGTDRNTITGGETFPHVTQSESMTWNQGKTVVVNYNDSRDAPSNFSGMSVSTDAGGTWTRLLPSPLGTGHGTNFGDPILVYNAKLGKWFAGDLVSGGDCGGQGIGLWTSTAPAVSWATGACVHVGFGDDRESMWVDNNATSPHYGRMYVSWNDFGAGGSLVLSYSDDGTTWTEVTVNAAFVRDVQLSGGRDGAGTVWLAAMDEGGGGFNPRQNIMFTSTTGGTSWTSVLVGAPFAAPGDSLCTSFNPYFAQIDPIWRYMGWGQPAGAKGGIVGYDYTVHGAGTDGGDIFFTRSTDSGVTWSTPVKLNTDTSGRSQWMPSLLATDDGHFVATWYDRRNTTDGFNYERWGRESDDYGATWGTEFKISSVLIPQPAQPDPFIVPCYAGDYNNINAERNTGYDAWTDGRVSISGTPQQDVFAVSLKF